MDKQEREAAKQQLEEMMKDLTAREQIKNKLDDFKKNIKDDKARQDFERSINELADKLAKYDRDLRNPKPTTATIRPRSRS